MEDMGTPPHPDLCVWLLWHYIIKISNKSSYDLTSLVPKQRRVSGLSPIQMLKAVKNEIELQGMRNAQVCLCPGVSMSMSWCVYVLVCLCPGVSISWCVYVLLCLHPSAHSVH